MRTRWGRAVSRPDRVDHAAGRGPTVLTIGRRLLPVGYSPSKVKLGAACVARQIHPLTAPGRPGCAPPRSRSRPYAAAIGSPRSQRHVLTAEQRLNTALEPLGEDPELARVHVIVGDMGYFDIAELGVLQAVGIRTAVADPVRNRRADKLSDEERQVLRRAQLTTRSKSGRALMRRRGELGERSFRHVLDYGGARRTTLRGRVNIWKRYLVQAACMNLSLLLRHTTGLGTLKQTWAASRKALKAAMTPLTISCRWIRSAIRLISISAARFGTSTSFTVSAVAST